MAQIQQGEPEFNLEDFDETIEQHDKTKETNPVFINKTTNTSSYERNLLKKHFFKN